MPKWILFVVFSLFLTIAVHDSAADFAHPNMSYNTGQGHPSCSNITLEQLSTPMCDAAMASLPVPDVTPLPADFGIIKDVKFIRFNTTEVPVYNAPNGNLIENMTAGYTYLAPINFIEGWAELSPGRWVSMANVTMGNPSAFSGVLVNTMPMPFAWILWDVEAVKSPNGFADKENGLYRRYQLVNIFATINVNGWNWYLIGPGHWTNQKNVSMVYPKAPAEFEGRWVGVDLYEQNIVAYEDDKPVMASLISSGLKEPKWETNTGTFIIQERVESGVMAGFEGAEDYYWLDLVPYAQYFDGAISLHGTYWHDSFGYPHSHGCVNLSVTDAKWLYEWMTDGTTVYVYDSGPSS